MVYFFAGLIWNTCKKTPPPWGFSRRTPVLFNLFINGLQGSLNNSELDATIGDINISALGFADDIILKIDCLRKLKNYLKYVNLGRAQTWWLWIPLNARLWSSMGGPSTDVNLKLYTDSLKIVDTYKYLGITITSKYVTNLLNHTSKYCWRRQRLGSQLSVTTDFVRMGWDLLLLSDF